MRALGILLVAIGIYIGVAVFVSYTDDPNAFAKAMGGLACFVAGALILDREKKRRESK